MRADVGKELNMSVIGGAGDVVRLRLMDANEERIETAGKTFYAELRSMETDERLKTVGVTYSAERDVVLTLPEMGVGQYVLVVEVSADSGARERLVSGWVTYMEPGALVKPKVDASPDRLMGVIMDGERHRCVWYHTTHAEVQADRAEESAAEAEISASAAADSADAAAASAERAAGIASGMQGALDNAVDLVTQRAESAAGRAEDAAVRAESAAGDAEEYKESVIEKFNETDEFIEAFWRDASRVIVPNSSTGTWYVGGKDTGSPYRGANGKSPRVTPDGYWETWEWAGDGWDSGSWVDTGTRAEGLNGFSPYINGAGYWVYIDPVSGRQVTGDMAGGRDGIDGVTVRRILVDRYEDIPQSGDTCNGGFYYYVRGWKQEVTAERVFVFVKSWDSIGGGVRMTATNGESSAFSLRDNADATCRDINNSYSLVNALVVDDQTIELVSLSGEDLQFESYVADALGLMSYADFESGRGYDVYAWLENEGVGSWVNVGLANDLATAEVYGLMKYGTDKVVSYGAPVGQNSNGQATVPVADLSLPGAVRPTTQIDPLKDDPDAGGGTHMGSSGKMLVDKATNKVYGAMMHSYGSRVDEGPSCVGVRADGKTDVVWATLNQGGAVRLGSYIEQVANRPYILSVGAINAPDRPNDKQKLANNLMVGGALKHATKGEWSSWCPHVNLSGLASGGYYLGLHVSKSFNQSEGEGLTLNPATDKLLGGVKILQETLASSSNVPTGEAVLNYLQEQYYTKAETYTQAETDARIRAVVPDVISGMLASYATQSWTENRFVRYDVYNGWKNNITGIVDQIREDLDETTAEVAANKRACESDVASLTATVRSNKAACDNSVAQLNSKIAALEGKTDEYVKQGNSGIEEIWVGTAEEFAKVSISGNKWYLVLEN